MTAEAWLLDTTMTAMWWLGYATLALYVLHTIAKRKPKKYSHSELQSTDLVQLHNRGKNVKRNY